MALLLTTTLVEGSNPSWPTTSLKVNNLGHAFVIKFKTTLLKVDSFIKVNEQIQDDLPRRAVSSVGRAVGF